MKPNWDGIKSSVERGLHSARNEDQHAMRVHCGAGYRMIKRARPAACKEIADELHRASRSIEIPAAVLHMEVAMAKIERQMAGR